MNGWMILIIKLIIIQNHIRCCCCHLVARVSVQFYVNATMQQLLAFSLKVKPNFLVKKCKWKNVEPVLCCFVMGCLAQAGNISF